MVANNIPKVIENINPDFLSDWNRSSFVALIEYADKKQG